MQLHESKGQFAFLEISPCTLVYLLTYFLGHKDMLCFPIIRTNLGFVDRITDTINQRYTKGIKQLTVIEDIEEEPGYL